MSTWLLALFLACGGAETPATTASTPTSPTSLHQVGSVDLQGFKEVHGAGATVIDVRSDSEFSSGHVPGAIHVPVGSVSPHHDLIKDLPKDKPLYMICESGGRSGRAAKVLASAGYTTVNVEGGTGAWRSAGLPLEK